MRKTKELIKNKSFIYSILFLIFLIILTSIVYIVRFPKYCLFEQLLHFPCLACGLTRSFDGLIIYKSLRIFIMSNIFAPFVLFGIVSMLICSLLDVISLGEEKIFINWCNKVILTKTTLKIAIICWCINIIIYFCN